MFKKIREALWDLSCKNCNDKDVIIAFSPLIEKLLLEEMWLSGMYLTNMADIKTFQGIKTYNLHPYNEIVIYDSVNSCYFPDLIVKIEVHKKQNNDIPPDNAVNK